MPHNPQTAQLGVINTVDKLARSFEGQAWRRGGWAMDFCLGRVTRSHSDVDIYTDQVCHRQIVATLIADGWELDDRLPVDRQADLSHGGVDLSLNPIHQVNGLAIHGPGPGKVSRTLPTCLSTQVGQGLKVWKPPTSAPWHRSSSN